MKCPKCGYIGFEQVDRCRNCGYEFSLHATSATPDLAIRTALEPALGLDDVMVLNDSARVASAPPPTAEIQRPRPGPPSAETDLPLFGAPDRQDLPLIAKPSPPRPPLAVRRATPELPRVRVPQPRAPMLDLSTAEPAEDASRFAPWTRPDDASAGREREADGGRLRPAGLMARASAFALDLLLIAATDAVVVYLTLAVCGLSMRDLGVLPKIPLIAFFVVQNGGYFAAFTAGGQTIGKMIVGIRVLRDHGAGTMVVRETPS